METAQEPNRSKLLKVMETALKPNAFVPRAEWKRPKSRILETALKPNPISIQILKTDHYIQIIKTTRERFLLWITLLNQFRNCIPEANIPDATEDSNLATDDDFDLAMWFWSTIIEMYERAAEFDGTLAKPREPNFVAWAQEVRLLRQEHGCSHDQIRTMIERIQRDQFWCEKFKP
jgi:hypothetical protein